MRMTRLTDAEFSKKALRLRKKVNKQFVAALAEDSLAMDLMLALVYHEGNINIALQLAQAVVNRLDDEAAKNVEEYLDECAAMSAARAVKH